jgi:hypothetical protein
MTDEGRTIKIERVQVGYTVETGDGPERKAVTLGALRKHCRTERVADLIEDLELLCQDVETADGQRTRAVPRSRQSGARYEYRLGASACAGQPRNMSPMM